MKEKLLDIAKVEIHELAELTPTMTEGQFKALKQSIAEHGQQIPVVTYRGKVIDGRHRIKALRELGLTEVKSISEESNMSYEDIREKIMNVYENRRHQTPTQKAIMAYREYAKAKKEGEKISQGAAAELYGTTVKQLGRAQTLHKLAGDDIIELLFQGNKLNTGTISQPNNTDSLATLILYYKNRTEDLIDKSDKTKINEDFTDEEIELTNNVVRELRAAYSDRILNRINKMVYYSIKYKKEV